MFPVVMFLTEPKTKCFPVPFTLADFLQTRFKDDTPQGLNREGHTRGGLQPQKRDGFTMSTGVHSYGPEIDTTETLRRLEPYQSRSVTGGQLPSQQNVHADHLGSYIN